MAGALLYLLVGVVVVALVFAGRKNMRTIISNRGHLAGNAKRGVGPGQQKQAHDNSDKGITIKGGACTSMRNMHGSEGHQDEQPITRFGRRPAAKDHVEHGGHRAEEDHKLNADVSKVGGHAAQDEDGEKSHKHKEFLR